ncbi:winged helix-turn-helix domain-containing protein [Dysgonomonas macrotermitis]|uniref:Winged helix-turn-helix domain n=1 Tax=Dysgonomonas macrotermitis TaxID=1346286 RepID=A0A1M5G4W7_9BACT|nr:Winged helix-turn-helix domain [Dysgonomonas macrotermitis]
MMKQEVDIRAKFILGLLLTNRKMSLRQIVELTKLEDTAVAMTLGWLLHKNKIILYRDRSGNLTIEFNNIDTELYY